MSNVQQENLEPHGIQDQNKGMGGRGAGGLGYMWRGARHPPEEPQGSFEGMTALVTGANSGLGLEAAKKFAALGVSRLILAVRDIWKGEDAKSAILDISTSSEIEITVLQIDCNECSCIVAFVDTLTKRFKTLDVAVLNAGVAMPAYQQSSEGYEMSIQVNVLATALLAVLLLPLLRRTAAADPLRKPVMEVVGSVAFADVQASWIEPPERGQGILDYVSSETFFSVERQYHVSKLLVKFVVDTMAEMTGPRGAPRDGEPVIMSVCPGMCKTNLGREFGAGYKIFMAAMQFFVARTQEQGGRALVTGVQQGGNAHGKMWMNDTFDDTGSMLDDGDYERFRKRVWDEIWEVVSKAHPDVEV